MSLPTYHNKAKPQKEWNPADIRDSHAAQPTYTEALVEVSKQREPDHTFIISQAGGCVDHRVSLHPDNRWHVETHHANPDGEDPYEWEPRGVFNTAREAFLWVGENEIGIEAAK